MPTTTTTYSFQKPVVGGDSDTWGGFLNDNADKIDDILDGTLPITPAAGNDIEIIGTNAATNTVTTLLTLNSQSSGTPASGIGAGIDFKVETAAGNTEVGAKIEAACLGVLAGAEDFRFSFKTMEDGAAAAEALQLGLGIAQFRANGTSSAAINLGFARSGSGEARFQLYSTATDATAFYREAGANGLTTIDHNGTGNLRLRTVDSAPIVLEVNAGTGNSITATTNGYLRMGASTGGIQFNGDTAAANALDDYEEGSFTPTVVGTSTAGTGTYTTQSGSYTKIGNVVVFRLALTWTAHTGTGNIQVDGLPFTASAFTPVTILSSNLTYSNDLVARITGATSSIEIASQASGAALAAVAMDTAATLQIQGAYRV